MNIKNNIAEDVKIAYIGGGSRGWAWGLMGDLAAVTDMRGSVYLYDIDFDAAMHNEIIGNNIRNVPECLNAWDYKAVRTIGEALTGADFVVISILPGTFDEMESDVHAPEKYGIYQSVGDTTGPGGVIRALRTIPMMEEIALNIKEFCPKAWVINYTNPMSVCIGALYRAFPEIKAFGCCHEVFGTQSVLIDALSDILGIEDVKREDIKINVLGINHFTWFTKANYKNIDLFPVYRKFSEKYSETGYHKPSDTNWMNRMFVCEQKVKLDLFNRYGYIAAAGDRHLAEFCDGSWYLGSPEQVEDWHFALTSVAWRKDDLKERLKKSAELLSGEKTFEIKGTGEEGVRQMRSLLGLDAFVTNVNIPNYGQIPNLPIGCIVETNASFAADSVIPVFAGGIPQSIYSLISRIVGEQQMITEAGMTRDLDLAFAAFVNDPLTRLSIKDARKLFGEMIENTKKYLTDYNI